MVGSGEVLGKSCKKWLDQGRYWVQVVTKRWIRGGNRYRYKLLQLIGSAEVLGTVLVHVITNDWIRGGTRNGTGTCYYKWLDQRRYLLGTRYNKWLDQHPGIKPLIMIYHPLVSSPVTSITSWYHHLLLPPGITPLASPPGITTWYHPFVSSPVIILSYHPLVFTTWYHSLVSIPGITTWYHPPWYYPSGINPPGITPWCYPWLENACFLGNSTCLVLAGASEWNS